MIKVNIREFAHNMSHYLKKVKAGERVVICERNKPVADLMQHNEHVVYPSWKRKRKMVKIKGKPLSQAVIEERRSSKW